MAENVWILGIHMTKFGKHPDKDVLDLAAEAAIGALRDAGVGIKDIGVLGAGNLIGGPRLRAAAAEADRADRHPCLQRRQRLRDRRDRTAGRDHGRSRPARPTWGSRSAWRSSPGAGLLTGNARAAEGGQWVRDGRFGAVAPLDGRVGTETMPGVFAQIGMEYGYKYGGADFELFARISEKNHAHSTLNPKAAYQKRFTLEEIMNDVMIAYPNTRPMCSANCDGAAAAVVVSESKLRTLSLEQQRRAVKISASVLTSDPVAGGLPGPARHQHAHPAGGHQAYEQAGVGPEDLDLVELHDCFATAELVHYDNLQLCEPGGAVDFFESGAHLAGRRHPGQRLRRAESKGHPVSATGIANIWEVATHLRGEAGDRQIPDAKVGLAHVIGLGSACGVHILERSAA